MSDAPVRVGILTVSDGVSAGRREDRSGDLIARWTTGRGWETAERAVAPDRTEEIVRHLVRWADAERCELILTTGGTGLAARDVTPEATQAALEREAPGVAEWIRARGMEQTPRAALGRGVAGVRGSTLIVNLPGSPAGVEDGLQAMDAWVEHAVELLRGHTEHD